MRLAGLDALIQTKGPIPKDGSGGAFGYAIVTKQGLGAVIASTTHEGVKIAQPSFIVTDLSSITIS